MPLDFYAVVVRHCALSESQSVILDNLADFFECAFLIPFEVDHVEHLIFFLYHTKRCVVRVPGTLAHHRRITRGAAPFGCAIMKKTAISKRW